MNVAEPTASRSCPLCGGRSARTRRTVDGWDLATCDRCGFLYAPVVRVETATEFDLPADYEPVSRRRHAQVHRILSQHLAAGSTIVDVGAGFGELGLVAAQERIFDYIGFEPSQSVARAAGHRDVVLRAERFSSGSLDFEADAIVLDNVLEHVDEPRILVHECVAALRDGGILVVVVPNRWDVRQVVPAWRSANHWIPPEHINYFTSSSLRALLTDAGVVVQPFGVRALGLRDWRYAPRALAETVGVFPFGLNVWATKRSQ